MKWTAIIYSADPLFASMNLELCSIFISLWKGEEGGGLGVAVGFVGAEGRRHCGGLYQGGV